MSLMPHPLPLVGPHPEHPARGVSAEEDGLPRRHVLRHAGHVAQKATQLAWNIAGNFKKTLVPFKVPLKPTAL